VAVIRCSGGFPSIPVARWSYFKPCWFIRHHALH